MTRTQVCIIGSGPAGLLLGQILHKNGIDAIILEQRDRAYVEARIRAGVLEQGAVDLMRDNGVGERLDREGLVHAGVEIALNGERRHIDMKALTGKNVIVYGQTEVTKDLINARIAAGLPLVFEAENVTPLDIDSDTPKVRYEKDGKTHEIHCDFVAGCDGFHGIARKSFPSDAIKTYERVYPFGWLGILVEAPPAAEELIYARHERGFALFSMRSHTLARHYVQVDPNDDIKNWPDSRVFDELRARIGDASIVHEGKVVEKSIIPMRSFVAEPMRSGRLFLAGDAAHIVPPTGAKGLNLAASDVHYLSQAFIRYFKASDTRALDDYSTKALARIWKAQRFSWWMTSMLHTWGEEDPFENKVRTAELAYVMESEAAMRTLAENYVGLPY